MTGTLFTTIDSGAFEEVLDVERYSSRSSAFDRLIASTHAHYWDPADKIYIDFDLPFDMESQAVLPFEMVPELHSAVADRLSLHEQISFTNDVALWWMSSILHGEQAALSLSAGLCQLLRDPGTVEFAANQAREEARHVNAFTRYIAARWGRPAPASPSLRRLLVEMVAGKDIYKKLIGMQLLVEGMAMGIFSVLHRRANDPVLRRLTQLVMVDEAFHHRGGKVWAEDALPFYSGAELEKIEDWALQCFRTLVSNMMHPNEKQVLYQRYGLEVDWVLGAMREAYASKERRKDFMAVNRIFHPMVKALLQSGVVTRRTRHHYALWTDLRALEADTDDLLDDTAVNEGFSFLEQVNCGRTPHPLPVSES